MALKLYKEDIGTDPAFQYVDDGAPPSGYTATDDPVDWDTSYPLNGLRCAEIQGKIDTAYQALGTPTTPQKEAASRWFVVDKAVRDTVYTAAKQEMYAKRLGNNLKLECGKTENKNFSNSIKDGTAANAISISAKLVYSGVLKTKEYTTTEMNDLTGMSIGDIICNNTLNKLCFYNGSGWEEITSTLIV